MVQRCCVPFCKSRVGDTDIYGVKLKFHRMPNTVTRFAEWANKITDNQRFKPFISSGSRVCSKHFHKEDYLIKIPFGNNPLKKEILPSIFQWNSLHFNTEILTSEEKKKNESEISFSLDNLNNMDSTDSYLRNTTVEIPNDHNINRNIRAEVIRKNTVIQQLLTRISELENEEKGMKQKIAELRAVNTNYEQQIKDLMERNNKLEISLKTKVKEGQGHGGKHTARNPEGLPLEKKIKLDK